MRHHDTFPLALTRLLRPPPSLRWEGLATWIRSTMRRKGPFLPPPLSHCPVIPSSYYYGYTETEGEGEGYDYFVISLIKALLPSSCVMRMYIEAKLIRNYSSMA